MTEKRYFEKRWEEEYYIFDSNTISESDFEKKLEYQDYRAFEDSMMGDEVVNRLNELSDENEQLKQELIEFKKWGKYVGDVKREDLDKVFKMSIYEIVEAFTYYEKRIKELEE